MKGKLSILIAACLIIGSGCANKRMTVTAIDPEETCPPGKTCVFEYTSDFDIGGGGRAKVVGFTGGTCTKQVNGQTITYPCGTQTVVAGINPDRLDTLGGAIIRGGAQVWSMDLYANGIRDANRGKGPGLVILNDNKSGASSGSNSGAYAGQSTEVGIGIQSGCENGKCYDPR